MQDQLAVAVLCFARAAARDATPGSSALAALPTCSAPAAPFAHPTGQVDLRYIHTDTIAQLVLRRTVPDQAHAKVVRAEWHAHIRA